MAEPISEKFGHPWVGPAIGGPMMIEEQLTNARLDWCAFCEKACEKVSGKLDLIDVFTL
jgi:hypothetical protein